MDYAALKAELAKPAYTGLTDAAARAALQSATVTRLRAYRATTRSLMADLGPTLADTILGKLETAAPTNKVIERTLKLLTPAEGGVDLGHPVTRAQMDALAGTVLTASEVAALKALGEETVLFIDTIGGLPLLDDIRRAREMP